MRTTIRLPQELRERARKRAAEEGRSFTSLVEEGLNLILAGPAREVSDRPELPLSRAGGGLRGGVELNRSADLVDLMDGR